MNFVEIYLSPNLAKMLMKKSKEETEHAEHLAKFQLERDGTIWAGNSLPNTGKNLFFLHNLWLLSQEQIIFSHTTIQLVVIKHRQLVVPSTK